MHLCIYLVSYHIYLFIYSFINNDKNTFSYYWNRNMSFWDLSLHCIMSYYKCLVPYEGEYIVYIASPNKSMSS